MNAGRCSSASSSSVTSWAHRRDIDKQQQHMVGTQDQSLESTGSGTIEIPHGVVDRFGSDDYMDVMEELGGMDPDDIWDPSSLFSCDDGLDDIGFNNNNNNDEEEKQGEGEETAAVGNQENGQQEEKPPSEDLATMFFEWLKSNKESISAEDLRSIKLKRSTIECAAKRLGGGKEGMKQLLKLILEWVQNHQLQKKQRMKEGENSSFPSQPPQIPNQNPNQNPNPSPDLNPNNPYLVPSMPPEWLPHHQPTYIPPESTTVFPPPMMYGYLGEPLYNNGAMPISPTSFTNQTLIPPTWSPPPHHYTPSTSAAHYPGAFSDQNLSTNPPPPHVVPSLQPRSPYLYPTSGDRLVRLGSSATKEARKTRMARQKRFYSRDIHTQ